jgi:hypothetical protein
MNLPSRSRASGDIVLADGEELNLRNRYVAAILAWLIPGAGHYYQRRYLKSAVFFLCIMSSFLIGMLVSSGHCVYASWNGIERRWQYILQAGIGLPAMPAAWQSWTADDRNFRPAEEGFMEAPRSTRTLDDWNAKTASGFDMGTLYTMVAGLLNVLVIFDAFAGPLPPPVAKDDKRRSTDDEPEQNESNSPRSSIT